VSYEIDYANLRRELWLATDAAYIKSAENLSKKQATLKNKIRKDTTWDFLKITPSKNNDIKKFKPFPKNDVEELIQKMSATFKDYPEVHTSRVSMEYLPTKVYYVNSEGTEFIKMKSKVGLEVSGSSQADDGMIISNFYSCYANNLAQMPTLDSMVNAARNVAVKITEVRNAPALEDTYAGPVLFTDNAAAEIFAQVFAPNLVARRAQLSSSGFPASKKHTAFQRKIGGRVLPEFMSMDAKPSMQKIGDTPIFGTYKIDDEGTLTQDFTLVKEGYLKNLFSSRVPTKRIRESNGHKRGGSPSISNIVITTADKKKTLSYEDLKEKMMKLCKDRELEYGLVVKRIMNPNIFSSHIVNQIFTGDFSYMRGNALNLCEVYKVYPDGKEELVRGAEGTGFTHQSFKDIIFCGNDENVYNYWGSASGYGNWHAATIVTPSILFEDGEIGTIDSDFKKPPLLSSPLEK
jgi:predicted Zn-dependent protease